LAVSYIISSFVSSGKPSDAQQIGRRVTLCWN